MLKPAESLEGHWAPSRAGFGAAMGAMARWPVTPEGRAAQATLADDGICNPDSPPVLSVFDEFEGQLNGQQALVGRYGFLSPAVASSKASRRSPARGCGVTSTSND